MPKREIKHSWNLIWRPPALSWEMWPIFFFPNKQIGIVRLKWIEAPFGEMDFISALFKFNMSPTMQVSFPVYNDERKKRDLVNVILCADNNELDSKHFG